MLKKIGVFNHKGGVSKTTTSFHLGWALAKKGKKVILVDADSQCNLTLYALGYKAYEDFYESGNSNNIKDALDPAYKSQPRLVEPAECIRIPANENLLLLPGHLDFSENEVQLGVALQLSSAFETMKNLPGAFNYLIAETAKKYDAEFVIIDMNPSLSAINQDFLLSCNFFIIPTSPDFFSVMAVKSLSRVIPRWERWAKKARPLFSDATYPFPQETPKFLGYTINDFNLSKGHAQGAFRKIMDKIANEVVATFIPALEQEHMLIEGIKYKAAYDKMVASSNNDKINYSNHYCLAEISNFYRLGALSNQQSIPVFELHPEDGSPSQGRTLEWFKFLYDSIANRILELVK